MIKMKSMKSETVPANRGNGFHNTTFLLGVNYWPRKSGVRMWRNFEESEIDTEFAQIHEMGCDTVRIFPLWDDFQPIYELPGALNQPRGIGMRHDWNMTPGRNPEMIDPEMLRRFDLVLECASRHHLKLIVALLTAWMSGTLFNPTWRGGRNLFQDSFMLKYQMLYCRAFAERYRNREEILAWEYGNEQNCADRCASPECAWVWLHALAGELRLHDPDTPIASGMHGLVNVPSGESVWSIEDNADAVDLLTTHPYPPFTPGCFLESPTDLRANLHATVESRYLRDLGKRPVLCEETGAMGDSALSEPLTAAYLRMRLYSLFANGIEGCLWWCYSDFACGDELPYRDVQMENDGLGLTRADGELKPAAREMRLFHEVVKQFGGKMPELERHTAIIVSDLKNDWTAAFNCYILCVQAGLNPVFIRPDRDDPAPYLLLIAPSLHGSMPISVTAWNKITEAVRNGATLYVSGAGISLRNMKELFGIAEMEMFPQETCRADIRFRDFTCSISANYRNRFHVFDAEVSARYPDGTPAMLRHRCGKGTACFLSMPLEASMAQEPFAFEHSEAWKIYETLKQEAGLGAPVDFPDEFCERFWNADRPGHGWLTVINHRRTEVTHALVSSSPISEMKIQAGKGTLRNKLLSLEGVQAAILEISLKNNSDGRSS